jgi:hypothetical protein
LALAMLADGVCRYSDYQLLKLEAAPTRLSRKL